MNKVVEKYYLENHDKLVKDMAKRCGNFHDAEDIVQQAFLNALEYYDGARIRSFDGWFIGVLNNAFLKHMNDNRHYGMGMELPEDSYVDFDECRNDVRDLILKEIGLRKQPTRSILFMHFIQELPVREIAQVTDCTKVSVNQALKRFRKMFKDTYGTELAT